DGVVLVVVLLFVPGHHVFDLELLHDLLLLQVRVLLLSNGACQLLRVRLSQAHLQLSRQGVPVETHTHTHTHTHTPLCTYVCTQTHTHTHTHIHTHTPLCT